ncbi:MAG: ABC transporter ATP-binding protein [Bacteriovoracaceae bacterium]|jgi:ATP-binding cassette, subfamily B, multidrug efflux pump|nr:ABC transporter ATP-binding protein [Bacteriovoracaceae bacterium]
MDSKTDNSLFIPVVKELVKPYKKILGFGCIIVVLINALEMIPPLLLKNLGDSIQSGAYNYDPRIYAAIFLGIYIAIGALKLVWRYCFFITSRYMEVDLKKNLFEKILLSRFSKASSLKVGTTVSLLSYDTNDVRMYIGIGGLILIDTITYLIYIPFVLYTIIGIKCLILLIPFALIPFGMHLYEKNVNFLYEKSSKLLGDISDKVHEESVGVKIFRVLRLQGVRRTKFRGLLDSLYETNKSIGVVDLCFESFLLSLIFMSRAILFLCAYFALTSNEMWLKDFASLGVIILVLKLLDKLIWPMMSFSYLATLSEKAKAAVRRMSYIYELEPAYKGEHKVFSPIHSIDVEDLYFTYPNERNHVLDGIHFKASQGQKIGIVGDVGAGKSTLLRILASLHQPSEIDSYGKFQINEIDYRNINYDLYRNITSYIPQESIVFNSTLSGNLSPNGKATKEEIHASLKDACLDTDLKQLPKGIETLIGEKGVNLSGGQRQRVSIARSFLSNASLYLWDDTISALDVETERKVVSNIFKLNPEAILVLATHRPSALMDFDNIYILMDGKVIEEGNFSKLMQIKGHFYNLFQYEVRTREVGGIDE